MDVRVRRPVKAAEAKPDRKRAILLAAEKLFAEHGFHGVSIRAIADEAGVPLALVGYYYGPKHDLFRAIFEHWDSTVAERLAGLADVMAQPWSPEKLRRIVEAFIDPVIRLRASPEGEFYARLITHGTARQNEPVSDGILREFFDPMAHAFIHALRDTLAHEQPEVTLGQVAWCYQFALGALVHHINDIRVQRLSAGANRPNDPAAARLLADFIVHGIRGVVQPPATKPKRRRS